MSEKFLADVRAIYGAYYWITSAENPDQVWKAKLRGRLRLAYDDNKKDKKKYLTENVLAVGDKVEAVLIPAEERVEVEAYILQIQKRKNTVTRANHGRMHILGANVDAICLISSTFKPAFSHGFIDRVFVESCSKGIPFYLIINKIDLLPLPLPHKPLTNPLDSYILHYQRLDIQLFKECLLDGLSDGLQKSLLNKRVMLLGQSGVGKSTLVNKYFKEELQPTGEIGAHERGKHITRNPKMFTQKKGKEIIDVPGVREFGLHHIGRMEIQKGFPEISEADCRFPDCSHTHEPNCNVRALISEEQNSIPVWRYNSYCSILKSQKERYKPRRGNIIASSKNYLSK